MDVTGMSFGDEDIIVKDTTEEVEADAPEWNIPETEDAPVEPESDPQEDEMELLKVAEATGSLEAMDESAVDAEVTDAEGYERFLRVVNKAMPLPEGFPSTDERAELMKVYGRLRIRRIAPGEAYLVRPIRRLDMPTFRRIQLAASELQDEFEAEMFFENELAKAFCLYPVITDEDIDGTGSLGMGGTVSIIANDAMSISNMSPSSDVGIIEDL